MLESLLTEQRNPASTEIDRLSTEEMLRVMNDEDAKVATAVRAELPNIARAVDAIADALASGGRLFYIGAGTSGRLGVLDASECPPTFNVPPDLIQGVIAGGLPALVRASEGSEDDPIAGWKDLLDRGFRERDVVCGIATSGRTPYVVGAIYEARKHGAKTIGLSCTPGSELGTAAEIAITPLPGPEVITGSTRMKAGTATKLVLNMLSTGVMIRLGYVFSNLMVNVQPTNEKLRDRARRIVRDACGISDEEAARALGAADRQVAPAIVMVKTGLNAESARELLAQSRGRVFEALERASAGIGNG